MVRHGKRQCQQGRDRIFVGKPVKMRGSNDGFMIKAIVGSREARVTKLGCRGFAAFRRMFDYYSSRRLKLRRRRRTGTRKTCGGVTSALAHRVAGGEEGLGYGIRTKWRHSNVNCRASPLYSVIPASVSGGGNQKAIDSPEKVLCDRAIGQGIVQSVVQVQYFGTSKDLHL